MYIRGCSPPGVVRPRTARTVLEMLQKITIALLSLAVCFSPVAAFHGPMDIVRRGHQSPNNHHRLHFDKRESSTKQDDPFAKFEYYNTKTARKLIAYDGCSRPSADVYIVYWQLSGSTEQPFLTSILTLGNLTLAYCLFPIKRMRVANCGFGSFPPRERLKMKSLFG